LVPDTSRRATFADERPVKVNDLLTLDVTDLALGGKAVARHEGQVVMLDRGLPGDRVRARLSKVRSRYGEARCEAVEPLSSDRVTPPCPHVERCGGCRLQELDYEAQCQIKERQVRDTLMHLGRIAEPPMRPLRAAPEPFGYRNKMEFSFHPEEAGPILGLHERGTFDRVFALQDCLLPSRLTLEIVRLTQAFAVERRWRAYHPRHHDGMLRYLVVRHLRTTGQCAVHLVSSSEDVPGLEAWAASVASSSAEVKTVTLLLNRSRANVAAGESERLLVGDGTVEERLLGLEFEVSSGAFLQTNSRQAETLYQCAIDEAGLMPHETALDLYCGAGTLTLLLARGASQAIGVENVVPAVAAARRNAQRNGIGNARFVAGEARQVLRQWARGERDDGARPQVVVVDPPRAGLHPRVVARIAELEPRRVVYVSCNPATLARDLGDFAARGYRLAAVTPVDMFPHTAHIECVARLERAAA
jgi:23S rRNA (uracil1939-C5)-methyltransferase